MKCYKCKNKIEYKKDLVSVKAITLYNPFIRTYHNKCFQKEYSFNTSIKPTIINLEKLNKLKIRNYLFLATVIFIGIMGIFIGIRNFTYGFLFVISAIIL